MEQLWLWICSTFVFEGKGKSTGQEKGCVAPLRNMSGTYMGKRESVKSRDLYLLVSKASWRSLHPGQRNRSRISERCSCTMSLGARLLPAEGAGWECSYSDSFAPVIWYHKSQGVKWPFCDPKNGGPMHLSHPCHHRFSLCISRWHQHPWVGFVLESPQFNNMEENKQQQIYIALCHTSESKGGSSEGQSWYKQDAGLGKEERHMLRFFFVLSWTF